MIKTIVFDFDGTLAYGDSLTFLFNAEIKRRKSLLLFAYYWTLKLLSKLRIISVKSEKERTLNKLFRGDIDAFQKLCQQQMSSVKFTPVKNDFDKAIAEGNRVVVLSASAEYFLEQVFKDVPVEIISSTLTLDKGKIKITQHPYGKEKYNTALKYGLNHIDVMFYDSKSDENLMSLCDNAIKI